MAETVLYTERKTEGAQITAFDKRGFCGSYHLGTLTTIGRMAEGSSCDIKLDSPIVSRKHGQIMSKDGEFAYKDLGSTNGSFVNGTYLGNASPNGRMIELLRNGDRILLDIKKDGRHNKDMVMILFSTTIRGDSWRKEALNNTIAEICVGRGNESGIRLKNPMVSEMHASFFNTNNGWAIIDHGSTNGVFLNGKRMTEPKYLQPFDVVRIADLFFVFMGNELYYTDVPYEQAQDIEESRDKSGNEKKTEFLHQYEPEKKPQPEIKKESINQYEPEQKHEPYRNVGSGDLVINIISRNVVQRFKQMTLLQDINLSIGSGEMVLILGGSGAGKTTFMNAVMGYEKAEGQILYKNTDIYQEYARMKYEIGFVPQQDLIRDKDSVYDTLDNAAEMRLPRKMSVEERHKKLEEVLDRMGLSRERDSLVSKLSGGQKKRLSIAVELISDPSLFFLDEPDSGIDDVMGRGLMETLRGIADTGKIVMVITHSPERAGDLFDKVIVLAKSAIDNSGHLAFYGSVDEAFKFFEAERFRDIVQKINRPDENGDGLSDYYIEKYREYSNRK